MAYDVAALEKLIEQFQKIPSIGRKTAQRMAFHVLDLTDEQAKEFADAIIDAHTKIHHCTLCHNLTENELCPVCASPNRDHSTVCVMEEPRDVLAMERTREFNGVYHVLHGAISPMNNIGPDQLTIKSLVERAASGEVKEFIMALLGYITIKSKDSVNSAKWYGKVSTFVLYASMILMILIPDLPIEIVNALTLLCAAILSLSLIMYIRFYIKILCDRS